jgi:hypothetical protein
MAQRRMFALKIIDSDAFLDMPVSAQNLYFHLAMRADDDGFIGNPKRIMKMIGSADDDIRILAAKRFILTFDTGIVVIKHWRIHNYISRDRYTPTIYKEEIEKLFVKMNGAYTDHENGIEGVYTKCLQNVDGMYTKCLQNVDSGKVRIVKLSKGKNNKDNASQQSSKTLFKKPILEEVSAYCKERGNTVDAEAFIAHYESNGWMVGRVKMKDWRKAVLTWERNEKQYHSSQPYSRQKYHEEQGVPRRVNKTSECDVPEKKDLSADLF